MNWNGLEQHRVDLTPPMLLVRGSKGLLGCGYFNLEAFDSRDMAMAIVRGVNSFDDMVAARVLSVSRAGEALGIRVGDSGESVLEKIR